MDLELRDCSGKLTRGADSLEIAFDLFVDRFGEVSIQSNEIPLIRATRFLLDLFHEEVEEDRLPMLIGQHPDGAEIEARYLQVVSHNIRSGDAGSRMSCRMLSRDLLITMEAKGAGPPPADRLVYIFPKLKCFRVGSVETSDGCYFVGGATDIGDHNELGGTVTVALPPGRMDNLREYDARVEALLDYLSLANGRLLRWSVREHYAPTGQVSIYCRGNQAHAGKGMPLFPYLHLRPAVEAALRNIAVEDHRRLGLHVAIGWALLNSQFTEANFQGMMTALEHLVHVGLPDDGKAALFPRRQFRAMRPLIDGALRAAMEASGVDKADHRTDDLVRRAGDLNRQSLQKKILTYLEYHAVPAADLIPSLPGILKLRNDVVHRGLADDYKDGSFSRCFDNARELLARIFMSHLKYSGPYESFLGGNSMKQFSWLRTE